MAGVTSVLPYVQRPFLRWLSTAGDGTHTTAAITGNYSAGPGVDFYFQVPAGFTYEVAQILITISCGSGISQNDYGNIVGGLTNGVKLIQKKNGVETQLIGGLTVKKNYEFLAATDSVTISSFSGGSQTIQFSFDSFSDLNSYIELNGNTQDQMIFRVQDNFTTLVNQKVIIRGVIR